MRGRHFLHTLHPPAVDELSLAEPLESEHLVVWLQGCVAELVLCLLGKLAHHLSGLVHSCVLVKLVQVHLYLHLHFSASLTEDMHIQGFSTAITQRYSAARGAWTRKTYTIMTTAMSISPIVGY